MATCEYVEFDAFESSGYQTDKFTLNLPDNDDDPKYLEFGHTPLNSENKRFIESVITNGYVGFFEESLV